MVAYAMKKRASKKMAHGGETHQDAAPCPPTSMGRRERAMMAFGGEMRAEEEEASLDPEVEAPMEPDDDHQSTSHEEDMVGRIMKKRFAEGGEVAGDDEIEADFLPNEFDAMELASVPEKGYTAANSGDELGNTGEDERRRQMVAEIMRGRRMGARERMPSPA